MSSNTSTTFTKEQLFACLEYDGIAVDVNIINKAKNNEGEALRSIGYEYKSKKQDYSKTMAWYRLAANQNDSLAYNEIGILYDSGQGVSQDYLTAMEYFLQAARGNHHVAMSNIGVTFFNGDGVLADKYKALEWFIKSGEKPEELKKLNKAGFHLREEDKNKTIYQLINETEDIRREERMERESKLKEEIAELKAKESKSKEENEELKKAKSSNEQEMENLRKDYQTLQIESQQNQQQTLVLQQEREFLKQQLKEREAVVAVLHSLVQSKTNEIQLLQKDNKRLSKMR